MPLTPEQQEKIKDILKRYAHDVQEIVATYKGNVLLAIQESDKKKTDELHRLISQS
jgi:hypothetical protein